MAKPNWIPTVARRKRKLFQKPIRSQVCSPWRRLAQLFHLGAARRRQAGIYQNHANCAIGLPLTIALFNSGQPAIVCDSPRLLYMCKRHNHLQAIVLLNSNYH